MEDALADACTPAQQHASFSRQSKKKAMPHEGGCWCGRMHACASPRCIAFDGSGPSRFSRQKKAPRTSCAALGGAGHAGMMMAAMRQTHSWRRTFGGEGPRLHASVGLAGGGNRSRSSSTSSLLLPVTFMCACVRACVCDIYIYIYIYIYIISIYI